MKYISVCIPTFNGEKYIQSTIEMVFKQKLPKGMSLDFIIIDSGSIDGTVDIIKKYDKINFFQISNMEFGHGKTRQFAVIKSKGEYVLFLTQDATPISDRWALNMIEPFYLNNNIACVYGRQIPRQDACATIKREVSEVFNSLGRPNTIVVDKPFSLIDNNMDYEIDSFFSDVNSAVRRDIVNNIIPFRDLKYSEDRALAKDIQEDKFFKAYAPSGSVYHSNEYDVRGFYYRKYEEYRGLYNSVGYSENTSLRFLTNSWVKPTFRDWLFIFRDTEYSYYSKLYWLIKCPLYNFAKSLAIYNFYKKLI